MQLIEGGFLMGGNKKCKNLEHVNTCCFTSPVVREITASSMMLREIFVMFGKESNAG